MEVVPDSRYFHKEIVMTIVMTIVALLKAMRTEAFFWLLKFMFNTVNLLKSQQIIIIITMLISIMS